MTEKEREALNSYLAALEPLDPRDTQGERHESVFHAALIAYAVMVEIRQQHRRECDCDDEPETPFV